MQYEIPSEIVSEIKKDVYGNSFPLLQTTINYNQKIVDVLLRNVDCKNKTILKVSPGSGKTTSIIDFIKNYYIDQFFLFVFNTIEEAKLVYNAVKEHRTDVAIRVTGEETWDYFEPERILITTKARLEINQIEDLYLYILPKEVNMIGDETLVLSREITLSKENVNVFRTSTIEEIILDEENFRQHTGHEFSEDLSTENTEKRTKIALTIKNALDRGNYKLTSNGVYKISITPILDELQKVNSVTILDATGDLEALPKWMTLEVLEETDYSNITAKINTENFNRKSIRSRSWKKHFKINVLNQYHDKEVLIMVHKKDIQYIEPLLRKYPNIHLDYFGNGNRSTNEYRECTVTIQLGDYYKNPVVTRSQDMAKLDNVDCHKQAMAESIQTMFRGCARDGKEMTYIKFGFTHANSLLRSLNFKSVEAFGFGLELKDKKLTKAGKLQANVFEWLKISSMTLKEFGDRFRSRKQSAEILIKNLLKRVTDTFGDFFKIDVKNGRVYLTLNKSKIKESSAFALNKLKEKSGEFRGVPIWDLLFKDAIGLIDNLPIIFDKMKGEGVSLGKD